MNKIKTSVVETTKEVVPELTNTAVSTVYLSGKWHFVKVEFNPETLEAGNVELVQAFDRDDAVRQFKIVAADHDLV